MALVAMVNGGRTAAGAQFGEILAPQDCRVVVATDDERSGLSLTVALEGRGWSVSPCLGHRLPQVIRQGRPDLVVVQTGDAARATETVRTLRAAGLSVPLVMVIDSANPEDRAAVLTAGADDCLTLPMSTEELAARMHAVHRRPRKAVQAAVTVGSLILDPENGTLCLPGGNVHITKQQFAILLALARHLDQYVNSDRLVRLAQLESNRQDSSRSRVLAVVIYRLRRLLERCGSGYVIESSQGLGYRLARAVPANATPAPVRKAAGDR